MTVTNMRDIDLPGSTCISPDVRGPHMSALVLLRVLSRCQAPKGKRPEPRARDPVVVGRNGEQRGSNGERRARKWEARGGACEQELKRMSNEL